MSQLSNLNETRSYIAAWQAEPNGQRHINRAATESRANFEACFSRPGYTPTWCTREEYLKCVKLLENAATPKDTTK